MDADRTGGYGSSAVVNDIPCPVLTLPDGALAGRGLRKRAFEALTFVHLRPCAHLRLRPLFQAYHHAVEHRTNITSILATYDLPTPNIDLWAFIRAGEPG